MERSVLVMKMEEQSQDNKPLFDARDILAKTQDARQLINQKKRIALFDARDVLVKKAKTNDACHTIIQAKHNVQSDARNVQANTQDTRQIIIQKNRNIRFDARDVLNKKAQDACKNLGNLGDGKVKLIGNIVQKVDRHGRMTLQTKRRDSSYLNLSDQKVREIYKPRGDPAFYNWLRPDLRPASEVIRSLKPTKAMMRDVMGEEAMKVNSRSELITPEPSGYVDVIDKDKPKMVPSRIALQGLRGSTNVFSRLNKIPDQTVSHGIQGQPIKSKVVVPMGYKIVVSNLQSSVTEPDIKELFEDIGQLFAAKLVKEGVAEVIYKNLSDAQKAIEFYHNRELDGQPMMCLLVNKEPLNEPTWMPNE